MLHIKKYANGRFFDTENKKYIKQDQLADMIKNGEEIKVTLTKTGKDVTKSVIDQFTVKKTAEKAKKTGKKAKSTEKKSSRKTDKKARKSGKKEMPFLKTDKLVNWVGDLIDDKINKVLDIVKLPSREQVAQLDENIQALNKKIDDLKLAAEKKAKADKQETKKAKAEKKAAEKAVQETIEEALEEVKKKEAEKGTPDQENVDPKDAKTDN